MSIRAAIRAHVLLARIFRAVSQRATLIEDARAYFDLAKRLIHPRPPLLIAVGGLSGTGKSVLARSLAPHIMPEPGAVVLRSDVLRKQLFAVAETVRLPESAYRPEASGQVYDLLAQRAAHVAAQRHSAIVDAVFAREAERNTLLDVARISHTRFIGLFLVADLKTRQNRVAQRAADASDATAEVARLQEDYNIGTVDWAIIDASGAPEATLRECQARIVAFESA
jgi:predicted kinase